MRNFLKNINIVGATMAFREGSLIKYCLDDLIKYCDTVVVMLDNYDKKTEKIVLDYKSKNNNIIVFYSDVSPLDVEITGSLKKRLNYKQGEIRDQVLRKLEELNKKNKIDLLLWPDGDEIFTSDINNYLTDFWNSEKKVLYLRSVTVYDSFKIIKKRSIFSHARVFKYRPDMTSIPYRSRTFYRPFKRTEACKTSFGLIHLPLLTKEYREFRKFYQGIKNNEEKDDVLWFLDKDIRDITKKEFMNIINNVKPDSTIHKYNK